MDIRSHIAQLDPGNDDHWTGAGLPSVGAVAELAGENVTRAQIAEAWPGYDRDKANAPKADEAPPAPAEGAAEGGAEVGQVDGEMVGGGEGPEPGADNDKGRPEIDPSADQGDDAQTDTDAIRAIEDALALAGSPRYARNAELQAFVRQWQVQQVNIKSWQERLDRRDSERAARR